MATASDLVPTSACGLEFQERTVQTEGMVPGALEGTLNLLPELLLEKPSLVSAGAGS